MKKALSRALVLAGKQENEKPDDSCTAKHLLLAILDQIPMGFVFEEASDRAGQKPVDVKHVLEVLFEF